MDIKLVVGNGSVMLFQYFLYDPPERAQGSIASVRGYKKADAVVDGGIRKLIGADKGTFADVFILLGATGDFSHDGIDFGKLEIIGKRQTEVGQVGCESGLGDLTVADGTDRKIFNAFNLSCLQIEFQHTSFKITDGYNITDLVEVMRHDVHAHDHILK